MTPKGLLEVWNLAVREWKDKGYSSVQVIGLLLHNGLELPILVAYGK